MRTSSSSSSLGVSCCLFFLLLGLVHGRGFQGNEVDDGRSHHDVTGLMEKQGSRGGGGASPKHRHRRVAVEKENHDYTEEEDGEEDRSEDDEPVDRLYLYGTKFRTVMEYTETTNDFRTSTKPRIVEFYSPYCGACQAFAPKYVELSQHVPKFQSSSVDFYAVSCMKHKMLCNEYNVNSYPMMLAFVGTSNNNNNNDNNNEYEMVKRDSSTGVYTPQSLLLALQTVELQQQHHQGGGGGNNGERENEDAQNASTTTTRFTKTTKKRPTTKMYDDERKDYPSPKEKDRRGGSDRVDDNDDKETDRDDYDVDAPSPIKKANSSSNNNNNHNHNNNRQVMDPPPSLPNHHRDDTSVRQPKRTNPYKQQQQQQPMKPISQNFQQTPNNVNNPNAAPVNSYAQQPMEGGGSTIATNRGSPASEFGQQSPRQPVPLPQQSPRQPLPQQQQQQQQVQMPPQFSQQQMPYNNNNNGNPNGPVLGARKIHGAQRRQTEPLDMDRWKNEMALRRQKQLASMGRNEQKGTQKLIQKQIQRDPRFALNPQKDNLQGGTTKNMAAYTPGTREFQQRREKMAQQMERWNRNVEKNSGGGRKGLLRRNHEHQQFAGTSPGDTIATATATVGESSRPQLGQTTRNNSVMFKKENLPFRREIKKQTLAEKLPVVKRFKKLSHEEGLYLDISNAFITGIQFGVHNSVDPISGQRKKALRDWLDLLSVSIPQEWALHELIGDLHSNLDFISLSQANLLRILDKHKPPRRGWSDECNAGYNGLSCALWRLMHTVTVGVAEHQGGTNLVEAGMVDEDTPTFTPMSASGVIRGFIANFFGCKACRDHFIAKFDDCSYRRCIRLADDSDDDIDADDWKELALWLWEVHNAVSVRVASEKAEKIAEHGQSIMLPPMLTNRKNARKTSDTEVSAIQHLWPSLDKCLLCFQSDGSWNEEAVFAYMEKTYWAISDDDLKKDRLLQLKPGAQAAHFGILFYMAMAALALIYTTRKSIAKTAPYAMTTTPSYFLRRAIDTVAPTQKRSV